MATKSFVSINFLIINVHPWNKSNLDSYNNLHSFCDWAPQSSSPHWDTRCWCFDLAKESFLSIIFLIIKIHSWNETNMDTRNNLCSFFLHALQSCSPRWDIWYWCFGLARKAFFPTFSLQLEFVHQLSATWILIIISIIFVIEHYNHVFHIGMHDISTLDLQEKLFFPQFPL